MRIQFVASDPASLPNVASMWAATAEDVQDIAPWAAEVLECEGGWMAFESAADAARWKNQK